MMKGGEKGEAPSIRPVRSCVAAAPRLPEDLQKSSALLTVRRRRAWGGDLMRTRGGLPEDSHMTLTHRRIPARCHRLLRRRARGPAPSSPRLSFRQNKLPLLCQLLPRATKRSETAVLNVIGPFGRRTPAEEVGRSVPRLTAGASSDNLYSRSRSRGSKHSGRNVPATGPSSGPRKSSGVTALESFPPSKPLIHRCSRHSQA